MSLQSETPGRRERRGGSDARRAGGLKGKRTLARAKGVDKLGGSPSPCPRCCRPRFWKLRNGKCQALCKFCAAVAVQTWKLRNPEKARAHKRVQKAIQKGRIERRPCEVCGEPFGEAHHHQGYTGEAVFALQFLCRRHHAEVHRRERRQ